MHRELQLEASAPRLHTQRTDGFQGCISIRATLAALARTETWAGAGGGGGRDEDAEVFPGCDVDGQDQRDNVLDVLQIKPERLGAIVSKVEGGKVVVVVVWGLQLEERGRFIDVVEEHRVGQFKKRGCRGWGKMETADWLW